MPKSHAEQMKEMRARKKLLGLKEFRADVTLEELKYFEELYAAVKLERKLKGLEGVLPT